MTTVQIDIQDDLINLFGVQALKQFIEDELAYQRFLLLENEIQNELNRNKDVEWEDEFEAARQQAFEEYKSVCNRKI